MNDFAPVTPDHLGKKVECSNDEQKWHQQELVQILPQKDSLGVAYIGADTSGIYSLWKHARAERPLRYAEIHRASGLKPGDWVKVTRRSKYLEGGWSGVWMADMDHYLDCIMRIKEDYSGDGFVLESTTYLFPCFVLEKVDFRPVCHNDLGKIVQYRGQACVLEGVFTPRYDDSPKAVIDCADGLRIVHQAEVSISLEGQA